MNLSPGPRFRLVPFTPDLKSSTHELRPETAILLRAPDASCDSELVCLGGLPSVWGFHVQCPEAFNLNALYRFADLKYLGFGGPVGELDCTRFPSLEWLIAEWAPGLVLPVAESRLKRLRIFSLPPSDLSALPQWRRLEHIEIVTSRITALTGIERWCQLRKLTCQKLTKLKNISEVASCERLESVFFESCAELKDVSALGQCPSLQQLGMSKCGAIDSVGFVANSRQLREVRLVKTWVRDGNMRPLAKLGAAIFDYRAHYTHTESQIASLQQRRE